MNMQTMRDVFAQPQAVGQTAARALLPPFTTFSVARPSLRLEEKPQIKDLAQKKAREAYSTMMAGVGFQARCSGRED